MANKGMEKFARRHDGGPLPELRVPVPGPAAGTKKQHGIKTEHRGGPDGYDGRGVEAGDDRIAPFYATDGGSFDDTAASHNAEHDNQARDQQSAYHEDHYRTTHAKAADYYVSEEERSIADDEMDHGEVDEAQQSDPRAPQHQQNVQGVQDHLRDDNDGARVMPDGNRLGVMSGDSYPNTTSGNPSTVGPDEAEHALAGRVGYDEAPSKPMQIRRAGARMPVANAGSLIADRGGAIRPIAYMDRPPVDANGILTDTEGFTFAAANTAHSHRAPIIARNAPQPQHKGSRDATQASSKAVHNEAPPPPPPPPPPHPSKHQHNRMKEITQALHAAHDGPPPIAQPRGTHHDHAKEPTQAPNAAHHGPSTTIQQRGSRHDQPGESTQMLNVASQNLPVPQPGGPQQSEHHTERTGTANQSLHRAPQDHGREGKRKPKKINTAAALAQQTQSNQLLPNEQDAVADQRTTKSRRGSESRAGSAQVQIEKPVELDYEASKLFAMKYEELKAASFDVDPKLGAVDLAPEHNTLEEKLSVVARLNDTMKSKFFAGLTINEWEDAGDWFLQRFGEVASKLKDNRRKKRKIAQEFENEVEKRHGAVSKKMNITTDALSLMKQSGAQVLEGTPKKAKKTKK
ncbi:unnamed protein product [Zymoseptoria tritici ST99CH_1E4]|uniref:Extracellular mutant protein 11 C-terminal domain-containing protein n=1 Tax=Zymoseptoria tritici ST99CH_1E4 TaxID=1276532 RepID=A0A2H1GH53_ZYMTR|nr:unnamed protein product [Zymoseptoria tritici ST99CH_1E4]